MQGGGDMLGSKDHIGSQRGHLWDVHLFFFDDPLAAAIPILRVLDWKNEMGQNGPKLIPGPIGPMGPSTPTFSLLAP